MKVTRLHLDWQVPLLPAVAERLQTLQSGRWIDLSHLLVIVPTVQAGRRLRETLALTASATGGGLLAPQLLTPESLLSRALSDAAVASETCVMAAWATVLEQIDCEHFQALFPVAPATTVAWQLGMARQLIQLCRTLGEDGLTIHTAAERACVAGIEAERWRELARLEGLYLDQLKRNNQLDPNQARQAAAQTYQAPKDIERIILVATPDPQPLALKALQQAAHTTPVDVWIYGPDAELFDDWGRPHTDPWTARAMDLEAWNCHLQSFPDAQQTAAHIAQATQNAAPESVLIGLADPALNPTVGDTLRAQHIPFYNPEGEMLQLGGVGRLAELLCELAEGSHTSTIRTLLQHPDIVHWLGATDTQEKLLSQVDTVFERHLAADLPALLRFSKDPALSAALKQLKQLERSLAAPKEPFAPALATALQTIYSEREIELGNPQTANWQERAGAIRKLLDQAHQAETLFPKLPAQFIRAAFQQTLRQAVVYPERPENAHDLLGWLELLWNDAPHLILAGINETIVPESIVGDAFLPESLRGALGLRTNAQRFARDAYLLEALCQRRRQSGRIELLVPQTTADGSPLKPSRLMFLGSADTLVPRTQKLFVTAANIRSHGSHTLPWKLRAPSRLSRPDSISVSALTSYLTCPFRFFLKEVLGMRPIDVETRELSAATFGNLFHDVVEELKGRHLTQQTTAHGLIEKLHAIAEQKIQHRYGKHLSFALRLQKESLLARLSAFCERQIEDIKANGCTHILDTEVAFENFSIEGVQIKGRIDRTDQRDDLIELIDYKTSDTPKNPQQAHLVQLGKKGLPTHVPEEALFELDGKTYRWINLQLPLYALAMRSTGKANIRVAYFNLAKTLDKSEFARWHDLTEAHLDSAYACAAAVIRRIQAGQFWPPSNDIPEAFDDFAAYFPDGIEKTVQPGAFENYTFA